MKRAAMAVLCSTAFLSGQPMDFTGENFYFADPRLGSTYFRWNRAGIQRVVAPPASGLYPATFWKEDGEFRCTTDSGRAAIVNLQTGHTIRHAIAHDCLALLADARALVVVPSTGEFPWQRAIWDSHSDTLERLPLSRAGGPATTLLAASYDGSVLFWREPGASSPIYVERWREGKTIELPGGLTILSITSDGTRFSATRDSGLYIGRVSAPDQLIPVDANTGVLSPAGNALFLQFLDGTWRRHDFLIGATETIVTPLPILARCDVLAPGGACLLLGSIEPGVRFALGDWQVPIEAVDGLGSLVRIPVSIPLGEHTAKITSPPFESSRVVKVIAAAPQLHGVAGAPSNVAPGDRLTLILSGWGDRRPPCFAYPYYNGPAGPIVRLPLEWTDDAGVLRAVFRMPALDFSELPENTPRRVEIDCGYQTGTGSQRVSLIMQ